MAKKIQAPEIDYEKKIEALEEELIRKQDIIDELRSENQLLLQTAFKNSERKVGAKLKGTVETKGGGPMK